MKGTLILAGSGEFTDKMEEVDSFVVNSNRIKKIAILPTAAGKEKDWQKWINDARSHFNKLHADVLGISVLNDEDANDDDKFTDLETADMLYVSGGDPGHLFQSLKNSRLWVKLKKKFENGMALAGSSAGAMILGKYVLSNVYGLEKGEDPFWEESFGLVDYSIIPHFDYIKREEGKFLEKVMNKSAAKVKATFMGIDEATALIFDKDSVIRMGEGGVYILNGDNWIKEY